MNIFESAEEVARLAERLGMQELATVRAGAVNFLIVPLVHRLLDRIEALERKVEPAREA